MWRLVLVLAFAGCQELFHLQQVTGPSGPDACAGHDEDGDGVPDGCDNCPTVKNADQANNLETMMGAAADAVGDACDPHPTAGGDVIASFWALDSVDGFDTTHIVTELNDSLVLGGDSAVLSQAAVMSPTLAVIDLAWTGATDDGNKVEIAVENTDVHCGAYVCGTSLCQAASGNGGGLSSGIAGTLDEVTAIMMASDGTCTIVRGALGNHSFANAYPYGAGKVGFVTTGATAGVTVHSLIVYGN